MRVLLFGFGHHARMTVQAKPHEFRAMRNGPLRRSAILRAILPLPETGRQLGRELFPDCSERQAWAAAHILWSKIEKADAVAVWNGSRDIALAAVRIAREQDKPVVFVENGFLPGTCQVDLSGINVRSSVAGLTIECLREMKLSAEAFAAADRITFRQRPLGRDTGGKAEVREAGDLPDRYVLFAAQVHDDSQIRLFSPQFASVEAAIRYVAAECAAADLPLVIKEHPSDHGRIDYTQLKADLPEVQFFENADNAALVAGCEAFVTVNSSMALQAVHAGKPVFTLGDAAYNLPGIANRILPPVRLRDALTKPEVDHDLRRRYLAYLAGVALVPCKSRIPDDAELKAVVDRMVALVGSGNE